LSNLNNLHYYTIKEYLNTRGFEIFFIELKSPHSYKKALNCIETTVLILTNFKIGDKNNLCKNITFFKQLSIFSRLLLRPTMIFNSDDNFCHNLLFMLERPFVYFYSLGGGSDEVNTKKVIFSIWGSRMILNTFIGSFKIDTNLIGKHNCYNFLCTVCSSISLRSPVRLVRSSLEKIKKIDDRCEQIDQGQTFNLLVDYADSYEAITNILMSIYESCYCKSILICGGKGLFDQHENENLLKKLVNCTKKIFVTTNEPLWIDTNTIDNELIEGLHESSYFMHSGSVYDWMNDIYKIPIWFEKYFYTYQNDLNCYFIKERYLAIRTSIAMAAKDDVIVISGRGSKSMMKITDETGNLRKYFFSDTMEAAIAINQMIMLAEYPLRVKKLPWQL